MNKGIIANGNVNFAQVISGKNIISNNNNSNNNNSENVKVAEELEGIEKKLGDLNLKLSEHKYSLDELSKKVSIIEDEYKEENPNKEKIKRNLMDLSSVIFQVTGTTNNLLQSLNLFK